MGASEVVLVVGGETGAVPPAVTRALEGTGCAWRYLDGERDPDAMEARVAEEASLAGVVVTADVSSPLELAHRVRRVTSDVEIVFLVGSEREEGLRQEVLRAPFVGPYWSIVDPASQRLESVLDDAVRGSLQRSGLRITLDRMNAQIGERPASSGLAERHLIISDRHLANVLEHAEDAVFSIDWDDGIVSWNRGAARTFGREAAEVVGASIDRFVDDVVQAVELRSLLSLVWLGEAVHRHELRGRRGDGSTFEAEVTLAPVRDDRGRIVSVSAIARDVTERKRREEQIEALNAELEKRIEEANAANASLASALERLEAHKEELVTMNEALEWQATTDALTGLKNRLVLHNSLREMMALAERQGAPLSLLLIDIDHFKVINDTWGHQAGDRALRTVAETLRARVREQDIVARFGGEEFAVVLPNTTLDAAMEVAETLRRACRGATEDDFALTVSVGGAACEVGDSSDAFIARADEALYASKRQGRDRVMRAGAPT